MSSILRYHLPSRLNQSRLDLAAVELSQLSRKQIRRLLDSGLIFVNKKRVWLAKFTVHTNDLIEIILPSTNSDHQLNTNLTSRNILLETEDFIAVNKPPGIAVDTEKDNLIYHLTKLKPEYAHLQLVHRLDKETSGVILLAKTQASYDLLTKLFQTRQITKVYRVICFDTPNQHTGTITWPIARVSKQINRYVAITPKEEPRPQAKPARTDYRLIRSLAQKRLSYLECYPYTGRPHQIRVHLKAIGNPVLGDKLYAEHLTNHPFWQLATRQMLHSYQLQFVLNNQKFKVIAPIPKDFREILEQFRHTEDSQTKA